MKRSTFLVACTILCLVALLSGRQLTGAETATANWLTTKTLSAAKTAELTPNSQPFSLGVDCTPTTFRVGYLNDGQELHGCAYDTKLGIIGNGYLLAGPNGTFALNARNRLIGFVQASPGAGNTIISAVATASGTLVKFSNYSPADLTFNGYDAYDYNPSDSKALQDQRGVVAITPRSIAYSSNGTWMVVERADGGIERVHIATMQTKLIGWAQGMAYNETGQMNFAISDDGTYIALNPSTSGLLSPKPSLRVYDADTCQDLSQYAADQYGIPPAGVNQCEYNDIWNGVYRGVSYPGIQSQLAGVEYPRHLRFIGSNTLSFDSAYDRVSSTEFKVASYQVSNGNYSPPVLSLLGMGDSYISGEGAFNYRDGTDTNNNKCHNSLLAYPQLIGSKLYSRFESVACSGAKMYDIEASINTPGGYPNTENGYKGQVKDDTAWKDRGASVRNAIINDSNPGYSNQVLFSRQYQPQDILLSIGGNDVRFSEIVTSCVSPLSAETCYGTYESRLQLMQNIIDRYDDLVKTYETVAESSGGKVFVVGYPQIAKPGGSCGANVNLNADEVKFSSYLISFLDSVIKRAASDAGVIYVDNQNALAGYRLCEAPKGKAAMNGFTVGRDSGKLGVKFIGQESYHPTAFGHQLLANSILSRTNNLTTSMPSSKTSYGKPSIDPNDPLLRNVPRLNYTPKTLIWMPANNTIHVLTKATKYTLHTTKGVLKSETPYVLVIHTEPVTLAGGVIGDGDVTVEVPADLSTGFHTLDLYGTDVNGQEVDIRQVVYVATPEDLAAPCMGLPVSGVDTDGDGIDDACDAVPDDPTLPAPTSPPGAVDENSLLLSVPTQADGETPADTQESTSQTQATKAPVTQNTAVNDLRVATIQQTAPIAGANATIEVPNVLGEETASGANSKLALVAAQNEPKSHTALSVMGLIAIIGVFGSLVALLWKRHQT